jgi:hypothetical protein
MAVQVGDRYFTESLAQHFGHKVEIARYTEMYTDRVTDYRLHCTEPGCEDPVGIAVEVVSIPDEVDECDHSSHLGSTSVVIVNLLGETTCLQCGKENK